MSDDKKPGYSQEEINKLDLEFFTDMENMLLGTFQGFMADTGMGNTPEARVICYTSLLQAAREEPFNEDVILQKLCETLLEREIHKARAEVAEQIVGMLRSWRG